MRQRALFKLLEELETDRQVFENQGLSHQAQGIAYSVKKIRSVINFQTTYRKNQRETVLYFKSPKSKRRKKNGE